MEKRKKPVDTKKRAPSTEATSDEAEYNFCVNSMRSLIKDPSFAKHRKTLEDVMKVFDKMYENWKKSKTKSQRLELEIASNVSKIKAALQLSEEDKSTIDTLKEELEKAWKMADEMRSKASISTMRRQSSFPDLGSINRTDSVERQSQLERQAKTIEDLRGDKVRLEMSLKDMSSLLKDKTDSIRHLESQLKVLEEQIGNTSGSDEERYGMMVEIENNRLRVFELEEEITAKDKSIEDLMKENESKIKEMGEKDTEICFLKAHTHQEGDENDPKISMATMTDSVGDYFHNEVQNLEAQIQKRVRKDKKSRVEVINLEGKLADKLKLLTEAKVKIKNLRLELHEKSEACQDLMDECNLWMEELKKSKSTIRELEEVRDRNVCTVGRLEVQTLELKKELTEFRHCKYPEEIERLNEKFEAFRKRTEEEKENWSKCKKSLESAVVENNEMKDFVSKIRNQIKVAVMLMDTFKEQNGASTLCKSNPRFFSKPMVADESPGDLSRFNVLVSYLVELCKDLTAENQKLDAEIINLRLLKPADPNKVGISDKGQVCDPNVFEKSDGQDKFTKKGNRRNQKLDAKIKDLRPLKPADTNKAGISDKVQVCGPNVFEISGEDEVTEKVEFTVINIDQNMRNADAPEKVSYEKENVSTDLVQPLQNDKDQLDKTGAHNPSTLGPNEDHEACDLPKNTGLKKNPVIRQKPLRTKSVEFLSSPEWKKFKDQVKLKTRRLNAMEANVEALNSKLSINQPASAAEKLRFKRKAPSSAKSMTLENLKKSFKKQ